jgi:hypothetical protein
MNPPQRLPDSLEQSLDDKREVVVGSQVGGSLLGSSLKQVRASPT